ncbi:MAG: PEP-CTERM sorting domain-containing protein [Phycisphaerales bacterium]|nr:PEP-CTERM sorting domain-containing protein [Phycisphaerales bacterium]
MFHAGVKSRFRAGRIIAAAVALFAATRLTNAAELDVSDLLVSYDTQTATSASGTISFTLRYAASGGDAGDYDLFSAQVLIARMGIGGDAKFTLNEAMTEDTGAIGADYWLPSPPTTFQNASTIGDEFRFTDFVSVSQGRTPQVGDIVARFVIDFQAENTMQLGGYQIAAGDSAFNFFNSDFVNRYDNSIQLAASSFELLPVPEPATLVPLLGSLIFLRRRR